MSDGSWGDEGDQEPGAAVSTRAGDDGFTGLLGPDRVPKYSSRPSAFGTLDEASSALGLGRALSIQPHIKETVVELQRGLYKLMAELATPSANYVKIPFKLEAEDVNRLDQLLAEYRQKVTVGREFVLPGGSPGGAALDLARTVIRRGERLVARLAHDGDIPNRHVLEWLNRLSDVVFVMARYEDTQESESDGTASRS
ncbi:MAG TPA: cob(I)yrinic acid a,c-diamide adenosyltransferase [Chloroflexota bacterium]|nr:cob(I)yrinic acid a,c-diamide adenosyltransferase [Chloroflexota bacterium]